jgi:hypothetical protein
MNSQYRLFLLVFMFGVHTVEMKAQLHDAVWLFGVKSPPPFNNPELDRFSLDFKGEHPVAAYQDRTMNIDATMSSFSDSLGNLVLYTNGIYLANSQHELIENGDSLNPGEFAWTWRDNGYPNRNSHLLFQHPGNPSQYVLFHTAWKSHPTLVLAVIPLYYTLIEIDPSTGTELVLEKNIPLVDGDEITLGTLTAVKHANGRDWWILVAEKSKNIFYSVLLDADGVQEVQSQELLPDLPSLNSSAIITFSPDGSQLARYQVNHGLYVYNFDRCTGLLEDNPVFIPMPETTLGGGLAYSPNGRFIYLTSKTHAFQLDLWEDEWPADTVAQFNGYSDPSQALFNLLQAGPDGKIYMNTFGTTKVLHTIDLPNLKGSACKVIQPGVHLPYYNYATSANFPNFRLGPVDGSSCDTLGLDNHPVAGFRHQHLSRLVYPYHVQFMDHSSYGPTEWYWDFGDGSTSTEIDPLHIFPAAGTYTVCLTVSNANSSDTVCKDVEAFTNPIAVSTQEVDSKLEMRLFPNPSSGIVTMELSDAIGTDAQVRVINLHGQQVHTDVISAGTRQHTLDISHLPAGVYWVSVHRDGGEVYGGKLVVQ